jgi:SAM-dependent methyltransferase
VTQRYDEHLPEARYDEPPPEARVARAVVPEEVTRPAVRAWWDEAADDYQAEHGAFLGDADFVWCPEGLREADAGLLGDVAGRAVLEIGAGAAQCARWLAGSGARAVALDLSAGQLRHAAALNASTGVAVPLVQASVTALPFRAGSFDTVCSAFGGLPFVADSAEVMREVARVLRPGGRFAFSVSHPFRWCFPDTPSADDLQVRTSYFDRRAYVEYADDGRPAYAEHHRTIGDRVREAVAAGLRVLDIVEPEWPAGHDGVWGQWSPERGALVPGTAIFVCEKSGQ